MKLKQLSLYNFRNIKRLEISPHGNFNIIYGQNAQGKTNILESIHILGTLKSFKNSRNTDLIHIEEKQASIRGLVINSGPPSDIRVMMTLEGKKIKVNNKIIKRFSDYYNLVYTVAFTPEDLLLGKGSPTLRRRFLDRAIFNHTFQYAENILRYQKAIRNRNGALVRSFQAEVIETYDQILAQTGSEIFKYRQHFIEQLNPYLQEAFQRISGGSETASIHYRPSMKEIGDLAGREALQKYLSLIRERLKFDATRGTTSLGPHLDDIGLLLNGKSLKKYASQGQHRAFILALKIAEIELLKDQVQKEPILLLDDVSSELDPQKNQFFFDYLETTGYQVFVSTTDTRFIRIRKREKCRFFEVINGEVILRSEPET